jgi:glutamate--cysteine ligase
MTAVRQYPHGAGDLAAKVVSDRAAGEAYVASVCFKHGPPRLLGVELEFTVHYADDYRRPLDPDHLAAALGPHTPRTLRSDSPALPLAAGSPLSLEPGCQVEISALPQRSLGRLAEVVSADLAHLRELLARAGLTLGRHGVDPYRPPRRLLDTPRYAAMERRFALRGDGGITMMASTTGLQVCLDAGEADRIDGRWAALHALGPPLLALFANSRHHAGADTGHASARWLAIMRTEPARTRADIPEPRTPARWARRLLDTPLMVVRRDTGAWDAPDGLTFADWIDGRGAAAALPRPTVADLDYHLCTVFTPVRPQGYLEVRYLDGQPPEAWLAPVALLVALLARQSTVDRVRELCEPVAGRWLAAARHGLSDPEIRAVAHGVTDLGCAELAHTGLPAATVTEVARTVQARFPE